MINNDHQISNRPWNFPLFLTSEDNNSQTVYKPELFHKHVGKYDNNFNPTTSGTEFTSLFSPRHCQHQHKEPFPILLPPHSEMEDGFKHACTNNLDQAWTQDNFSNFREICVSSGQCLILVSCNPGQSRLGLKLWTNSERFFYFCRPSLIYSCPSHHLSVKGWEGGETKEKAFGFQAEHLVFMVIVLFKGTKHSFLYIWSVWIVDE